MQSRHFPLMAARRLMTCPPDGLWRDPPSSLVSPAAAAPGGFPALAAAGRGPHSAFSACVSSPAPLPLLGLARPSRRQGIRPFNRRHDGPPDVLIPRQPARRRRPYPAFESAPEPAPGRCPCVRLSARRRARRAPVGVPGVRPTVRAGTRRTPPRPQPAQLHRPRLDANRRRSLYPSPRALRCSIHQRAGPRHARPVRPSCGSPGRWVQTPEPALPQSVRCEPARPSGAGRPAGTAVSISAWWIPPPQRVRCPRNRVNSTFRWRRGLDRRRTSSRSSLRSVAGRDSPRRRPSARPRWRRPRLRGAADWGRAPRRAGR